MTDRRGAGRGPAPRCLLAAAALALAATGHAGAQDFSLRGSIAQSFSGTTNLDLDSDDTSAPTFGSTTGLSLTAGYRTPRTSWRLGTSTNLRFFTGGDDESFDTNVLEPRFSGGMSYRAKRWRVSPFFNFARSRVRFNQLVGLTGVGVPIDPGPPDVPGDPTDPDTPDIPDTPDPGPIDDPDVPIDEPGIDPDDTEIEDRDATRTSFGFGSGFSYVLTPRTSAQLSASSQFVRFSASDDDLENTTRLNFSSSVSRAISERNTGSVSLGVSRFLIDSDDDPNATSVRATVGLSRTVSARLSFNTQAGIVYSVREELEGREDLETSTIGATGSVGVSWRNGEQRFGFNLAQSVQPSSGGEITNRLSVGASFSQPITRTQNFGLTTSLSRRTETFGEDEDGASFVARISPSYSLRLDRDWRASVRYNLTVGSSSDDLRFSNSVFLSVSRAFELYR